VERELQIEQLAVCSVFSLVRGAFFFPIIWMTQSEDLLIYWARNSIARGERNGKLKDKPRQTRRSNVRFFENLVRRGFAEPNGSKSQTGQGISPWVGLELSPRKMPKISNWFMLV
jgi:hypothetical protein